MEKKREIKIMKRREIPLKYKFGIYYGVSLGIAYIYIQNDLDKKMYESLVDRVQKFYDYFDKFKL